MRIKEMAVARSSPIWKRDRLKRHDEMEGRIQERGQEIAIRKSVTRQDKVGERGI